MTSNKTFKILVDNLSDENISRKEYNAIISEINGKVDIIWKFILK